MMKSSHITLTALMTVSLNLLAATDMDNIRERLTMLENARSSSGLSIGGEIGIIYDNNNRQNQDIFLDTAELSFIYTIERFQAEIVLEGTNTDADRSVDDVEIGDVIFTAQFEKFRASVGHYDAPFVAAETGFISDTLADGNLTTGVKALSVNTEFDGLSAIVWIEPNRNNNNGIAVNYLTDNFAIGFDTIKHALGGNSNNAINTAAIKQGISIHGQLFFTDITVIAEHTKVNNTGANDVKYTQLEVKYSLGQATLMIRKDASNEGNNVNDATLFGAAYDLAEGVSMTFEHRVPKIGDKITALQLAYEF